MSAGVVAFPWEQARGVFKAYDDMVATIPDELTLTPGFLSDPDGKPTVVMLYAWCGDRREDERVLDAVKGLCPPSMVQVGRKSPEQMLKDADPMVLNGVCWIVRTVTLAKLEPGAALALIDGMEHRGSPLSWIGLHPFHGVGERIPLESTVFALRARHFMVGIFAVWEPGEDAPHRAWADAVEAALKPFALPSAYPNYLGPDRPEQAAQAYGQNTARLLRVKGHYDIGSDWNWRSWGHLLESVRTGCAAFDGVFGEPAFDYLAKHADESTVFNEGMSGFTSSIAPAVAEAYDFSAFGTIVDVGGGHGMLLNTILRACPGVNGIVFDSPHVAAGAEDSIRGADLAGRCRAVGGDFFEGVPAGDAYLMKHIIHDWPDDRATTILRRCRRRANPGGKLLLIEQVVAPGGAGDIAKLIDLEMLVIAGGKERTEAEYRHLLAGAGWRLSRVIPTGSPAQIVEAEPA